MWRPSSICILGLALAAGCAAQRPAEEMTDDGLARVPSRSEGGVYRLPDASFLPYRRVILEPPSIAFVDDWRENHPEVNQRDFELLRSEAVKLFQDEFAREFVKNGSYTFAEDPAPDVVLIIPSIEELNIVAPNVGNGPDMTTYVRVPVTMKITGDLRDAATNRLIGRVIMYETNERHGSDMRVADRVVNAHQQRLAYARWCRLVREAIDVAKAERPRPHKPAESRSP